MKLADAKFGMNKKDIWCETDKATAMWTHGEVVVGEGGMEIHGIVWKPILVRVDILQSIDRQTALGDSGNITIAPHMPGPLVAKLVRFQWGVFVCATKLTVALAKARKRLADCRVAVVGGGASD